MIAPTKIDHSQKVIYKKIHHLFARLGRHLVIKSAKTNLNKDFYQLLNFLLEYPFEGMTSYQKFLNIQDSLMELLEIETLMEQKHLTIAKAEKRYLNLYYNIIECFLRLDAKDFSNGDTYYDHVV